MQELHVIFLGIDAVLSKSEIWSRDDFFELSYHFWVFGILSVQDLVRLETLITHVLREHENFVGLEALDHLPSGKIVDGLPANVMCRGSCDSARIQKVGSITLENKRSSTRGVCPSYCVAISLEIFDNFKHDLSGTMRELCMRNRYRPLSHKGRFR
jgi:hypothetical protein